MLLFATPYIPRCIHPLRNDPNNVRTYGDAMRVVGNFNTSSHLAVMHATIKVSSYPPPELCFDVTALRSVASIISFKRRGGLHGSHRTAQIERLARDAALPRDVVYGQF